MSSKSSTGVKVSLTGKNGRTFSSDFLRRFDEGAFWESYVATILSRNGLYVLHEPTHLGETQDKLKSFSCDLQVGMDPMLEVTVPVEVKSKQTHFNGDPNQYPYARMNVCSQNWFLKNWPGYDCTGRDFLFVSSKTSEILWLPVGTKVELGHETMDDYYGYKETWATAYAGELKSLSDFVDMVKKSAAKYPWD